MCVPRWKTLRARLSDAYTWAGLLQGSQDLPDANILALILRDHLDGVCVFRADILEGGEGFVAFLDLWVQGTGDGQGCKRDDGDRTHVDRECRALLEMEKTGDMYKVSEKEYLQWKWPAHDREERKRCTSRGDLGVF